MDSLLNFPPLIDWRLLFSRTTTSDRVLDAQSIFWVTKTKTRAKNKGTAMDGPSSVDEPLAFYHTPVILMDKLARLIYGTIEEKVTPNLVKYNSKKSVILCQALAAEIKRRVKQLNMRDYRIVTMLSIVPKQEQGVSYKMALHGDHLVDFFGNSKYETGFAFILGTVYMVYKH